MDWKLTSAIEYIIIKVSMTKFFTSINKSEVAINNEHKSSK